MTILIGLVGQKGSGKTSLAQRAQRGPVCNYVPLVLSFAEPMRRMLFAMGVEQHFMDNKELWGEPLDALGGRTLRHAMQTLGTQWGRECLDANVWTNLTARIIDKSERALIIVDDVRFQSEFDMLKERGALLLAVNRQQADAEIGTHESEAGIATLKKQCTYAICNNGTIREAVEQLNIMIEELERLRSDAIT